MFTLMRIRALVSGCIRICCEECVRNNSVCFMFVHVFVHAFAHALVHEHVHVFAHVVRRHLGA